MNTRVLLFAGLLATAAIAFSGVFAETTGVEITETVEASCFEIPGDPTCHPHPACTVAAVVEEVTGEPMVCVM